MKSPKRISRREMLSLSLASGGFALLPSRVPGRSGHLAPSDTLNIAFIGRIRHDPA
jgi:hypothetical protein